MDKKRVLGVLGGKAMAPSKIAAWLAEADFVIGADSGLLRVLEAGFVPDAVIGDFDSVPVEVADASTTTIVDRSQDITDCAKLLNYVASLGYKKVTLLCAEGSLSDHVLNTIHSAVQSSLNVRLALDRGVAFILKDGDEMTVQTEVDARVSLIPLEHVSAAWLSGVHWPLNGDSISPRG
ncbi:MAG TPA: thiamine diphosphokinase, partial [Fimbriimonas sp.]|nr:thiamine diphosphokinase [Fimbriimonas sp.]